MTRLNRTKAQKGRRYLKIFHALYPIKMVSTKIGGNHDYEKMYILPNLFIGHTLTLIRTLKEKNSLDGGKQLHNKRFPALSSNSI